jgi:hypothetical protein
MVAAEDTETVEALAVLAALRKSFDDRPFTVAEVIARVAARGLGAPVEPELADAVSAVADDHGKLSSRLFGWWLRKWRDRVVGGLRLEKKSERNGSKWCVTEIA